MDPFGTMFDFDFDGQTSPEEEVLGLMMMEECFRENDRESDDDDDPER